MDNSVKKVTSEFGSNTNGTYYKFPDGLMLQWGYKSAGGQTGTAYTLDVTFPLEFYATPKVVALGSNDSTGNYNNVTISQVDETKTGFKCRFSRTSSGYVAAGITWLAIGFWK